MLRGMEEGKTLCVYGYLRKWLSERYYMSGYLRDTYGIKGLSDNKRLSQGAGTGESRVCLDRAGD